VTEEGQLKLSDFGLVSIVAAAKLTATGKTMGTVLYMAPEQIRGTDISPAIDLYALGCVLFEMLTGAPPFDGDSPANVMHQHLKTTAPRVAATVLGCPAALDQLVSQLLSKKPTERPASALDVARALKGVSQTTVASSISVVRSVSAIAAIPSVNDSEASSSPASKTPDWRLRPALALIGLLMVVSLWLAVTVGNYSSRAEELWLQALESEHIQVRIAAAEAIGNLDTPDRVAIDALIARLSDESPVVRAATVRALGQLGSAARPAIPSLMKLRKDDHFSMVRKQAVQSLDEVRGAKSRTSWLPWILLGVALLGGWFAWKKISQIAAASAKA
jgi:hypothetical protein